MRIIQVDQRFKGSPFRLIRPFATGEFDRLPSDQFEINFEGGQRLVRNRPPVDELPLVSIITACRNAESVIGDAIDSVLSQSYKNVEHIIVDGASTDATPQILESYRDSVEYYVSSPDDGTYSAMNRAIALARGEYIAILNADDRLSPDFVFASLNALRETRADISYCDYHTEEKLVCCPALNAGLLFSQLDVKHNTFLISKSCFEQVGGFDEGYKIAADAKWNRAAYLLGMKFVHVPRDLVFYSTKGASSAATEETKESIIRQSAHLITECFGFLDLNEARHLYTSNFNTHTTREAVRLFKRYGEKYPMFAAALIEFFKFNLDRKEAYSLNSSEAQRTHRVLALCEELGLSISYAKFEDTDDPILPAVSAIDRIGGELSDNPKECVLHFARKFSSPSEPFIPTLLNELVRREPGRRHIMLCDERLLEDERPYPDTVCIPWDELDKVLRDYLYELLWARVRPTLIIAHFALNGFWLYQRLGDERRYTPTINICHGVDVFAIVSGSDYYQYIKEYCVVSPRVCFAPVSNYLCNLLQECGVPEQKIFRVNNSIPDMFSGVRKADEFFRGNRKLKILSVGRLIKWKGHDILLRALAEVENKHPASFCLQIVYGNWDEELNNLTELAAKLGISDCVQFVPFVDFGAEPDYYSKFDLFVLPSTLSDDAPPRTETFGVALLEAIAAGLPIVTTTAGGLPEVVGYPNDQAMIVKHNDNKSLANALIFALENSERVFVDNAVYANSRLAEFSASNQYEKLKKAEEWLFQKRVRIYHFSALGRGGAAGATMNIHRGLCEIGYDSVFVTREKEPIPAYLPNVKRMAPELSFDYDQAQVKDNLKHKHTVFSIDDTIISNNTILNLLADADIVNFAWYTQFISSENIAAVTKMGKPVLLTVRDMNPISGGCHFFHGCVEWQRECNQCPQLKENDDNFPHYVWRNKFETWNRDAITFVALSAHSRNILAKSRLTEGARVECVNNPLDDKIFYLEDREQARDEFGFDHNVFLIGYLPSFNSLIKGHTQFLAALAKLKKIRPDARFAIALAADAGLEDGANEFDVIKVGAIKDAELLRKFYNAVDIVAVPSLEETFSNTTTEAIACGAPVVGFQTGILAELFVDNDIGLAAPVGDIDALARGMAHFLDVQIDRRKCSRTIYERFSKARQIKVYDKLFKELMTAPPKTGECVRVSEAEDEKVLATLLAARKVDGAKRRLSGERRRFNRVSRERDEYRRIIAAIQIGGLAARNAKQKARSFGIHAAKKNKKSDFILDPYDDEWLTKHRTPIDILTKGVPGAALGLINSRRFRYVGIRKSGVPRNIPTPANFDVAGYLRANPDVKSGVDAGAIPSAYYHFLRFGRFEGRTRPTK